MENDTENSPRGRIERATEKLPGSGCWIWMLSTSREGYRYTSIKGKTVKAHRAAYLAFVGPIPAGLSVCHRCDTPACCNPSHLFLGTPLDNMRDKGAKGRNYYANQTHCKSGHAFTPENTRQTPKGRWCRACDRRKALVYYHKKKLKICLEEGKK